MSLAAGTVAAADPVALLNTAILESRSGDAARAQEQMRSIAAIWPDWDEPWFRLGQSLRTTGARDQAIIAYEAALAQNPYRAATLISLGVLRLQSGNITAATALLAEASARYPDHHEAWDGLGLALMASDESAEAGRAFAAAMRAAPDRVSYAVHALRAAHAAGEDAAYEAMILARLADPLDGVAAAVAGHLALKRGELDEAEALLETACALLPDQAFPIAELAKVHGAAMRPEQAIPLLLEAQHLEPDNAELAHEHAIALSRLYRFAEAEAILSAALEKAGLDAGALCNRANQRASLGDMTGAIADISEAFRLHPGSIGAQRTNCALMAYQAGTSAAVLRDAMITLGQSYPHSLVTAPANPREPGKKLRIGLLSNTLRTHPVGWLTLPGIESLDQTDFSIHCFGRQEMQDLIAQRFARRAETWDGCEMLDDAALAAKIREREIDILIDLGGYGDAGRMTALIHRPAPVQVKWVGMQCATTGLAAMDWFISDRWETPAGFDSFYTERLLRLDDGYVCYLPPHYAPEVTTLPALRNGFVTFGCFNNLTKFTEDTLACWAELLRRLPEARLVLRCPQLSEATVVSRLRERCVKAGLDPDRISFIGRTPHRDFLAGYNDIDIALDPFPYSGGLTTCEALYMGVPVLTQAGEIFAARHSVSHLSNVGLDDWIAADAPDYIARAVRFATDLPALAGLREGLRAHMLVSPLCDAPRFGGSLAKGLRHAWRHWCEAAP